MSAWKRVALEKLPEYRRLIDTSDSPMALWIELHLKFEDSYRVKPLDEDLVRRFFEYARWCWQGPVKNGYLSDAGTAVACAFYEHLPQSDSIRRDLPRWLTRVEFFDLRDVFRYHLSELEFEDFKKSFLAATERRQKK